MSDFGERLREYIRDSADRKLTVGRMAVSRLAFFGIAAGILVAGVLALLFLVLSKRDKGLTFTRADVVAGLVVAYLKGFPPELVKTITTDNGAEFTDRALARPGGGYATEGPCALDAFCQRQGISHKLIRPRTPEHNGKVERSHRIDQERFYRALSFYSLGDLREQGARWMRRYNSTPRIVLKLRSPDQAEVEKLRELLDTTGEIRCPKLLRRLTSSES